MKFIILASIFICSIAFGATPYTEQGPLAYGHTASLRLDENGTSFRVQSFGNTVVSLVVKGAQNNLPQITFEGPLVDNGDSTPPGSGPQYLNAENARPSKSGHATNVQVTFAQPGVYRVLLHPTQTGAPLSLRSQCLGGCNRHEITPGEFLNRLKSRVDLMTSENSLIEMFGKYSNNPALTAKLTQALKNLMRKNPQGLERFPTLKLSEIGDFQPLVDEAEVTAAKAQSGPAQPTDPIIAGDLGTALTTFGKLNRESPPNVNKHLPGVGNGDFVNLALTKDQIIHSYGLAQILTSLALNNGSSVNFNGKTFSAPGPLLGELAATGHTVKVTDQRTYANFISFNDGDDVVRWPSWIDTDLKTPNGTELVVPMSHAQIALEIKGPAVNARLTFFLGISGAGFFPNIYVRPTWTGLRETLIAETGKDPAQTSLVSETVEAAATYLRRVRLEANIYAKGVKNDGYGVTEGVCCDSVAAVESKLRALKIEIPYPLMRSPELDKEAPLQDGYDQALRALPHDAQSSAVQSTGVQTSSITAPSNAALVARIESMLPTTNIPWDLKLQKMATELKTLAEKSTSLSGSGETPTPNCVAGMNNVTPSSTTR